MEIYYEWLRSKILSLLNPLLSFVLVWGVSCNSVRQTASIPPTTTTTTTSTSSYLPSAHVRLWNEHPSPTFGFSWLLCCHFVQQRHCCAQALNEFALTHTLYYTLHVSHVGSMLLKTICRCCLRGSWAAVFHFPPQCASVMLWNLVRKHALLSSICYTHTSPHTGVHARRCSSSLPFICVWLWRGGFKWARMIMSMGALKRKIGCVCNTHKHTHTLTTLTHPCPLWNRPTKLGCLS